jgi:RNA polymerase sigma factor (sigma-70 family)
MNALNQSRCQDDRPLRVLMVRHERLVLNVLRGRGVRGADTEDVAAAVWFRVARLAQQGRWDPLRAVHTTDPFVPLVKTIAVNLARDFHRRVKSRKRRLDRLEQAARLFGNEWRTAAVSKPHRRQTKQAVAPGVPQSLLSVLAALPENLRRAYEMHADGIGCREIGKRLGYSAATAHRRVRRARQEIKTLSLKAKS